MSAYTRSTWGLAQPAGTSRLYSSHVPGAGQDGLVLFSSQERLASRGQHCTKVLSRRLPSSQEQEEN